MSAENAGHLLLIDKSWVGKLFEPVEIVENRMVDAVGAGRTDVRGGYTQVLQKNGVVGTTPQITHWHVGLGLHVRRTEVAA